MKALSKIASVTVLLAALVILPATLVAVRQVSSQMAAMIPHHASALEEAEFWARAFAP